MSIDDGRISSTILASRYGINDMTVDVVSIASFNADLVARVARPIARGETLKGARSKSRPARSRSPPDRGRSLYPSRDRRNIMFMMPVTIDGLAHIGIRVHDLERSVAFYELLGFVKTAGPIGPEPVAILEHPSGLEVNLVLNAARASEPNILMDVPEKHAGITHFALLCPDIDAARRRLEQAGIALSGGPVRFETGAQAIFVRDPDRNVIELHQRAS